MISNKSPLAKLFAILLAFCMVCSPLTALADEPVTAPPADAAAETAPAADAPAEEAPAAEETEAPETAAEETPALAAGFTSNGDYNLISMTEERSFKAVIEVDPAFEGEIVWSLVRDELPEFLENYPHQSKGGPLADWITWTSKEPFFQNIKTELVTEGEKKFAVLTFDNVYFFEGNNLTATRGNRNVFMDYTGWYDLTAADAEGKVLGTLDVRVTPYDSYHTYAEVVADLAAAEAIAAELDNIHIDVDVMGQSTQGHDMVYAVISDSQESIDEYLALTAAAVEDPEATLAKLKAGELEYKIPVMYTNIHADEHPATDANMNFIWALLDAATTDGTIEYDMLVDFTEEGKAQLAKELEAENVVVPDLMKDVISYLGYICEGNFTSPTLDLEKYYVIETKTLDLEALLDDIIFIVVPAENADGRTNSVRQNGNGFDINRDTMFQTQVETRNMTQLIAKWNPITLIELHGFHVDYQVEPCSPPHEPNFEYDLFAEYGIQAGEAFGIGAVANSDTYNSFMMPLRDLLVKGEDGVATWAEPWDDMSTNYTPQYSMLHGTAAYTIEMPHTNEATTESLTWGLIGHAGFVQANKDGMFENQLEGWVRGVNNVDADTIDPWYVDVYDNEGAEADVFRPVYAGNNNFFPEAYIIPVGANQSNPDAAHEMITHLLRNGVKLHTLTADLTVGEDTYAAGSVVVSMYQAKRNVANGALYDGALITEWPDLYSEPVTAFGLVRAFDYAAIDVVGAVTEDLLAPLTEAPTLNTVLLGEEAADVIVENASVSTIAMVNAMIDDGVKVGFITEGEHKADFVVAAADFEKYASQYAVVAAYAAEVPAAKVIEDAKVYIPGFAGDFTKDADGNAYGVKNYPNYSNTNYNFDLFAYGQQMGFDLTSDVAAADIIAGNRKLDAAAVAAVKAGTPYLAAGENTLSVVKSDLLGDKGFDFEATGNNQDCLMFVTYGADSLTTASYVTEGDDLYYAFGGALITAVPEGAEVLMTAKEAVSGFIKAENLEKVLGSVQAIAYKDDV
ncbi:MAG: peptidase M14, partial [Clostridia bacterium]|nr:peptidase M14 [Clostridia bacterium]